MPKQAATAPRSEPTKAPGKKRSRAVGKGAVAEAVVASETVAVGTPRHAPSHGEVSERAYALYAARGFREGDAVQDWLRAEDELRGG